MVFVETKRCLERTTVRSMFDDIEEDLGRFGPKAYLGTFILKIELGNSAMSDPDDLADALERVAAQVRNRTEYPQFIADENGNSCGYWEVIPNG